MIREPKREGPWEKKIKFTTFIHRFSTHQVTVGLPIGLGKNKKGSVQKKVGRREITFAFVHPQKTTMKTPTEAPEEWNSVEVKPLIRHLTLEEAIKTYESGQIEWESRPREGVDYFILVDYKVEYIVAAVETNSGWDIENIYIDTETLGILAQNEEGGFDEDYGWELEDITFWKPMEFPQNAGE